MKAAALSLLAAAGLVLAGCVSPQSRAELHAARCRRVRARLERQPDNAKLQSFAARYCGQDQSGTALTYAQTPSSLRCRKIQAALARHPDDPRFQRLAARYCPQVMNAPEPSAPPTPGSSAQPLAVPAAAAPAAPETPRALSPEEERLINEQLLP